jgi:aspartyl protease family protein
MQIANGSSVILPVGLVRSQEIDGRVRIDAPVAVAPPAMEIGLLGQDFYKGYDIAVKQDVIEFRRQASIPPVSDQKPTCLVDSSPKAFFVPIIGRKNDIPIVEVTFNDQQTFSMLFDTGASSTLITHDMAKKMDLIPVGKTQGVIANGSVATFTFAFVKTQRTSERLKRYMGVAIAPPELEMGLLGQDFFEGYDFTIKENVIEFRLRE